jgi:hypothetical protein
LALPTIEVTMMVFSGACSRRAFIWARARSQMKSGGTTPAATSAFIRARSSSIATAKAFRRDR